MNLNQKKLNELLILAKSASKEAGKYLYSKKNENQNVLSECGRDIKLEIDREAEKIIRRALSTSEIAVLGEELGDDSKQSNVKWIVDPLDGTSNYFRGIDQCCVSIALMSMEEVKIGVVYNFNTDELFSACRNMGAFLNGLKIKVSKIQNKDKASLTTGFPASESLETSSKYLDNFLGWKKVRMFGSAALSCAYIASGRCDVYREKGVFLWDFAAGICLVEEAGGEAIYKKIDDSRYSVNFTNGKL